MGRLGDAAALIPERVVGGRCTLCKWVSSLPDDDRAEALTFIASRDPGGSFTYGHKYLSRVIASAYDIRFTDHVILSCRTHHHGQVD